MRLCSKVACDGALAIAAFAEPNPAPLKAALALQGWLRDGLRAPMTPADARSASALLSAAAEAESGGAA
jgi:4-hydroxy-tetrahydrodipicolinate synthase